MVTTRASNQILLKSAKYSFLSSNYLSGVTSLVLSNSDGFYPYTIGDSSTPFNITNPTGTTFRYTYYYSFTVTAANATIGATYTNNNQTFTVLATITGGTTLTMSGTGAPSTSGTLTKASGTGDATITFSACGTDPEIGKNIQVNSQVVINAENFTAANNGTFTVTAFDTNWFEVVNVSGVAESNKTLGTGSLTVGRNNSVLLGEFGSETSEIVTVSSVDKTTHTLTVGATKYAHSQDTRCSALPYNQAIFYHVTTAAYDILTPITGYVDLQADSLYTVANDAVYSTGFSYYHFYNSITGKDSANSNFVPYSSFGENSVKSILETFYSLLNDKERRLITDTDSFHWLNDAYSIVQNELNLVNREYFVDTTQAIATVSGTQEYSLATDFSRAINVYNEDKEVNVNSIDLKDVSHYNYNTSNTPMYYIRGSYLGISPTPTSVVNYTLRYVYKTTAVSSYYENIDVPNNNFYCVINFMLHKAGIKLGKNDSMNYLKLFNADIERMKITSFKQNDNLDSWSISDSANV